MVKSRPPSARWLWRLVGRFLCSLTHQIHSDENVTDDEAGDDKPKPDWKHLHYRVAVRTGVESPNDERVHADPKARDNLLAVRQAPDEPNGIGRQNVPKLLHLRPTFKMSHSAQRAELALAAG